MQKNKNDILIKASILSVILILTSCANITSATSQISKYDEVVDYITEQLSIEKDDYLIYIWGPLNKGEEVFGTKEHIMDTPDEGYIVYIDLYPKANLFHPVQYVFLSDNNLFILLSRVDNLSE